MRASVNFCNNCGAPRTDAAAVQITVAASEYTPPILVSDGSHANEAPQDLQGILKRLGLEKYFVDLRDKVGCVILTDLDDVDREDLVAISMNDDDIRRLLGCRNNTSVSPQNTAENDGTATNTVVIAPMQGSLAVGMDTAATKMTLDSVLAGLDLGTFATALRDIGCVEVLDLEDLDREDLVEIGMDETEIDRLQGNSL